MGDSWVIPSVTSLTERSVHSLIAAYNSRHGEKCFPSYVFIIKKSRQIAVCNNLLW